MDGQSPRLIRGVETSLRIIDALQDRELVGVTELARELDLSKGTVYSHLATLHEYEYVVKDGGEYRLSLRFLDLGERAKRRIGRYPTIQSEVEKLANVTGELVQFVVEEHGYAIPIYQSSGQNAVDPPARVGERTSLHASASGKAILANLPDEQVDEIVDRRGLPRHTERTITDYQTLQESLDAVRDAGYAVCREERISGLCSISAVILAPDEEVLGALSVVGPASRFQTPRIETVLPNQVLQSSNVIELSLN